MKHRERPIFDHLQKAVETLTDKQPTGRVDYFEFNAAYGLWSRRPEVTMVLNQNQLGIYIIRFELMVRSGRRYLGVVLKPEWQQAID